MRHSKSWTVKAGLEANVILINGEDTNLPMPRGHELPSLLLGGSEASIFPTRTRV